MANWERTPPKSMSIEEIKKRVAEGLKRWRARGWLPGANVRHIATHRLGPGLDKQQRKRIIQACDLAIYALANNNSVDYCHAIDVINATRRQAGLSTHFMQTICEGIAEAAAACSGEPYDVVNRLAKFWLGAHFKPTGKVISLPSRGSDHGNPKSEDTHSSGLEQARGGTDDQVDGQEEGTQHCPGEAPSTRH